ncbi:MAG: hypothetical protein KKB50_04260 [Planctomycetes bacterium]|nr:hypothetical protein [Planctomycetota bacterium]
MMVVKAEYAGTQTDEELVPGVAEKLILVTRLCVSSESTGTLKLRADPGGAGAADVTPRVFIAANRTVDLRLGRRFGLSTGRGEGLGFSSSFTVVDKYYSVVVWYELVD